MFEQFPYADMQQLNLDWIIKIAKDFLNQYTNIQQTITDGLDALEEKKNALEALLDEWYATHSEDIANELADAITAFNAEAQAKGIEVIASIPDDYTALANEVDAHDIDINNIMGIVSYEIPLTDLVLVDGYYLTGSTTSANNKTAYNSNYIQVQPEWKAVIVNRNFYETYVQKFPQTRMVFFYNQYDGLIAENQCPTEIIGDLIIHYIPNNAVSFRCNFSNMIAPFVYISHKSFSENMNDYDGYVGEFTATFSSREEVRSSIILKANTSYYIECISPFTTYFNIYGYANSSNYKKITTAKDHVVLTNDNTERYLTVYNSPTETGTFTFRVYETNSIHNKIDSIPEEYYVNCTEPEKAQYSSLTQCLLDLQNNDNPKIIRIAGGNYNIYQEYINAGVPIYTGNTPAVDFWDYCVFVPKNTHIIGDGIVNLQWMPNPVNDQITPNQCKCVSTLNLAGSCVIENVNVYSKNGRYCIHQDTLQKAEYTGAKHILKNVKMYKYANDTLGSEEYGSSSTIGFGLNMNQELYYENCEFYNETPTGQSLYGHAENTSGGETIFTPMSSEIVITNSILKSINQYTIRFANVTSTRLHIPVKINNCYISGDILSDDAGSSGSPRPNAFDITCLNSGTIAATFVDPSNRYPIKVYNS